MPALFWNTAHGPKDVQRIIARHYGLGNDLIVEFTIQRHLRWSECYTLTEMTDNRAKIAVRCIGDMFNNRLDAIDAADEEMKKLFP